MIKYGYKFLFEKDESRGEARKKTDEQVATFSPIPIAFLQELKTKSVV